MNNMEAYCLTALMLLLMGPGTAGRYKKNGRGKGSSSGQVGIGGGGSSAHGGSHAPCYDCDRYNVMQQDEQPSHQKLVSSQCKYPCKCPNREIQCKAGVNIIRDGCECCYVCARTQGDLCNHRDKCDEDKGLYCDFQMGDGLDMGICRAKAAKSCEVDGIVYKDGEQFKPSCNRLCSCQNGNYACTPLCPQEERRPSSVHCKDPQLVAITGQCCKEWICLDSKTLPDKQDEFSLPSEYADDWQDRGATECKYESSPWSACTTTCGMGESIRLTNHNDQCQPVEQKRLCFVRPCEMNDTDRKGRKCKNTWRQGKDIKFQYNGCTSVKEYKPKYCSTCKRSRCCVPDKTKTNAMEWECADGKVVVHDFMWIKSCVCTDECP